MAAVCLLLAFSVPVLGIWVAARISRKPIQTVSDRRGRQAAFLSVCAPPLFVLAGVGLGLLGSPISDITAWLILWGAVAVFVWPNGTKPLPERQGSAASARVAHGILAGLILLFVAFHLFNHLSGWLGPDAHRAVMALGRQVYRSDVGEPILLGLLLAQIALGAWLVWWWSVNSTDGYRTFQVASGDYLAFFILTHLNSALISARLLRGVETDWAWATGAPTGLLLDAWNIRLLPHYAFAVFFVLTHLVAGLRVVLLAHGTEVRLARRVWWVGMAASIAVALAIALALCGIRLR